MIKKIVLILLSLLFLVIVGIGIKYYPQLAILNGYAARTACSCSFIQNRKLADILKEDLGGPLFKYAAVKVDQENKSASSSVWGLGTKEAIYVKGIGCILLKDENNHNVAFPTFTSEIDSSYQFVSYRTHQISEKEVKEIVDLAFDANKQITDKMTRALLVLHKDSLIIEEYAQGIDAHTKLLGWSMTKSVTNALVGILVGQGILKPDQNQLFEEWTDDRKNITLDDLLRMNSGLIWEEDYAKESDATTMLFNTEDMPQFASEVKKGKQEFYYSSGTTNLIVALMRQYFENPEAFLSFPSASLFHKIGMTNSIIETDEAGNFIGSSYMYATARDWARFGRLYLHDGVWQGKRILPESWVKYSTTETPSSKGKYGAHFWLNIGSKAFPDAPHDMYTADGYQGQYVTMIPSKDLVIVRLGLADMDYNQLIKKIVDATQD